MASSLAGRPLQELLDAVAAQTPAPGGGTSAAWATALAASLVEMAARFTLARDAHAERHARMAEVCERAAAFRAEVLALGERELHAFDPVLEVLKSRRNDPRREQRLRDARSEAANSPIAIARVAADVTELGADLARTGNPHLEGDAITGMLLAEAACRAATRLAEINLADAPGDPRLAEAANLAQRAAAARAEAIS